MPTLNKLVEQTKITYTTNIGAGDVTVVVQKGSTGQLDYTVSYVNGTGELPTWQDYCTNFESGSEVNLL